MGRNVESRRTSIPLPGAVTTKSKVNGFPSLSTADTSTFLDSPTSRKSWVGDATRLTPSPGLKSLLEQPATRRRPNTWTIPYLKRFILRTSFQRAWRKRCSPESGCRIEEIDPEPPPDVGHGFLAQDLAPVGNRGFLHVVRVHQL